MQRGYWSSSQNRRSPCQRAHSQRLAQRPEAVLCTVSRTLLGAGHRATPWLRRSGATPAVRLFLLFCARPYSLASFCSSSSSATNRPVCAGSANQSNLYHKYHIVMNQLLSTYNCMKRVPTAVGQRRCGLSAGAAARTCAAGAGRYARGWGRWGRCRRDLASARDCIGPRNHRHSHQRHTRQAHAAW